MDNHIKTQQSTNHLHNGVEIKKTTATKNKQTTPPTPPPPPPPTTTTNALLESSYDVATSFINRDQQSQYWNYHINAEANGRHCADDIFRCIFFNENGCILINISLKFVPEGQINNIPQLV